MGIKIELEKNLYLESDERQFIVRKYGKPTVDLKTGETKESYVAVGHYGTIEIAFNALKRKKMLSSNATSFQALVDVVEAHRAEVRFLLKDLEGHSFKE